MELLFGIVIGLLIAITLFIVQVILKNPIERKLKVIYETIPKVKQKGSIVEPESDIAEAQRHIIEENKKRGRDTKLSEITIE